MKRFEEIEVVGDGAFGIVTKCLDKDTNEYVAIKKMKQRYNSFDECLQLKEVKSLRKIKHKNIVKLLQVFRENEYLFLVFELLGKSLLKTIQENGRPVPECEIRSILGQILDGLSYIHRQGFFHRDMKPENLLWGEDGSVLKIADFGLAREIRSRPPFTEYISTRWYRAPEIILKSDHYSSPVDIWAVGAIAAELSNGKPLFAGNSETDQIYKICSVLGPPTISDWPEGVKLANKVGIRFSTVNSQPPTLQSFLPNASPKLVGLINEMIKFDPGKRMNAAKALNHSFFTESPLSHNRVSASTSTMETTIEEIIELTNVTNYNDDAMNGELNNRETKKTNKVGEEAFVESALDKETAELIDSIIKNNQKSS